MSLAARLLVVLYFLLPGGSLVIGTASHLIKLDDYIDSTVSSSASGFVAGYVSGTNLLRSWLSILSLSIIYMLITFKTRKHIYDVTNMFILFYVFICIKLLLKLSNILTIQKRNRQFSVVGFASMLKPNVFERTNYKRWRQGCILWLTAMRCYFCR